MLREPISPKSQSFGAGLSPENSLGNLDFLDNSASPPQRRQDSLNRSGSKALDPMLTTGDNILGQTSFSMGSMGSMLDSILDSGKEAQSILDSGKEKQSPQYSANSFVVEMAPSGGRIHFKQFTGNCYKSKSYGGVYIQYCRNGTSCYY